MTTASVRQGPHATLDLGAIFEARRRAREAAQSRAAATAGQASATRVDDDTRDTVFRGAGAGRAVQTALRGTAPGFTIREVKHTVHRVAEHKS